MNITDEAAISALDIECEAMRNDVINLGHEEILVDVDNNIVVRITPFSRTTFIVTEGVNEMSKTNANWQTLQEVLKTLTEQLGANAHEVVLLRSRLTCKNCLASNYIAKSWVCRYHGAIPASFKGSCERWQDNIERQG